MEGPITEIYGLVAELGIKQGVTPVKGKTWSCQIDKDILIAINGMDDPQELGPDKGMRIKIETGHVGVWYGYFFAGMVGPYGGEIINGLGVTEDKIIEALKKKIEES